jgi:hypothetical protein
VRRGRLVGMHDAQALAIYLLVGLGVWRCAHCDPFDRLLGRRARSGWRRWWGPGWGRARWPSAQLEVGVRCCCVLGEVQRSVDGDDALCDDRDVRQAAYQRVLELQVELAHDDDDLAGLVAAGQCLSEVAVGEDVVVVLLPAVAVVGVCGVGEDEPVEPIVGVAVQLWWLCYVA